MHHTATKSFIATILVGAFLFAPLTSSAMFLDPQKKQLICQKRALQAQIRQIEAAKDLLAREQNHYTQMLKQFNDDRAYVQNIPSKISSLIAQVVANYASIVAGNFSLDVKGIAALIKVINNALTTIQNIQDFIIRTEQIIDRWANIDKRVKREIQQVANYIDNIKNMSYKKTLDRCLKW
jgi:mannitol-specific phosphotransferase system IIBC component